jgi:valyl-tRNA synthetase
VKQSRNIEETLEKLNRELAYTRGFLASVQKKLSNEKFVANAKPEVVESERSKESDALARIRVLEEQIGNLSAK